MSYSAGVLINSALKGQELSLALKSGQLGAVRTCPGFPVMQHVCPVCSRGSPPLTIQGESVFQEQGAKPGAD